ncbi:lipopolysaccharide assembly protein LapB [Methylophilus sp. 5]|uniref:tetratricopeptide repeat protein n=1 Tax=Methylophilus sp. 5 TaxID=1112274 RepID=UPI0004ADE198|nr:tetratricopeptide repeat protein [Methylophilus sp. 5]
MSHIIDLFSSWQKPARLPLRAYRRTFMQTGLKRVEVGLSCLLWGCVALMSGLVWQQGYHMLAGGEDGMIRVLPGRLSKPVDAFYPINVLVLERGLTSNKLPSLFNFKQAEGSPPISFNHPVVAVPQLTHELEKPPFKPSNLVLQVQASPQLVASVKSQITMATQQLLSGQLALASQSFEQILQQDPHQVVALAGMLVVTSQRGDIQQREAYLSRIRQEIPDYEPDDDLFLMQLED